MMYETITAKKAKTVANKIVKLFKKEMIHPIPAMKILYVILDAIEKEYFEVIEE